MIYSQVYVWALDSIPLAHVSVSMPMPICVGCSSLVILFEIRKCRASGFVLLLQDCFSYLVSFVVPHNFFLISIKNDVGILIGTALNLFGFNSFEQYGHFSNINSFNSPTWDFFLYICVFIFFNHIL